MADFRDAVRRAADAVGGQVKLAEKVGCAQSEISRLCTSAQSISAERAVAIADATRGTGKEVRLYELLPPALVDAVRAELAATALEQAVA